MSATDGETTATTSSDGSAGSIPTGGMLLGSDPASGDPSGGTSSATSGDSSGGLPIDTSRDSSGSPSSDSYGDTYDDYDPCECFRWETQECDGGTGAKVCIDGDECSHWSECYQCEEGEPWPCNYVPCENGCGDGQECSEWGFCVQATWIPICERQTLSLSEIALQGTARDLQLADVDGDSVLDLVALLEATNEVEVALGDGAGHFFASTTYPTALDASNWSMVIADFNGDGWLDLAATSESPTPELSLLFGQVGVFGAPVLSNLQYEAWRTFAGDFDGDGIADLLTYNLDPNAELALYRGDGMDGFLAAVAYDDPNMGSFGITVGAIAGGALPDVIMPNPMSPSVTVLEYSQGLGFTPVATLIGTGTTPYDYVMAGDIDGDTVMDVVAYRDTVGSDQLQTWPQLMNGAELNVDWILPGPMADVDGDGRDDLVANVWGSDRLKVTYFDAPCIQTYNIPGAASDLAVGDLDVDGKMDIVASNGGPNPKVWILLSGL